MELPSITVKKQKLHPDDNQQDFEFKLTGGPGGSTVTVTSGDEFTWSSLNNNKTYVLTESAKTGWKVKNINCGSSANVEYDEDSRKVTIHLPAVFSPGQSTVKCTFINRPSSGSVVIEKVTDPEEADQDFSFTTDLGDGSSFVLDTENGGSTKSSITFSDVEEGDYFVTEETVPGWELTDLSCEDGDDGDEGDGDSTSEDEPDPATANIEVTGGTTVTCTFTNTRQTGSVQVVKDFEGTPASVTLKIGTSANADDVTSKALSADGSTDVKTVETGTYYVSESDLGDYDSSLACEDGEDPVDVDEDGAVVVGDDQDVVCTFTNTRQTGSIQVVKDFVGSAESVTLRIGSSEDGSEVASKTVSADGSTDVKTVETGTYYVSEALTTPGSYDSSLACEDGEDPVDVDEDGAVVVGDGDDIVCTFTNTATRIFTVAKNFSDNNAADVAVSLTCTSGTVVNTDPTASEADAASFRVNGFANSSGTCTATETVVPAGYSSTGTCTATIADGACTIVNELVIVPAVTTSSFTVAKDFSDGNAVSVPVSVSCTSGSVAANDPTASESDPADFTVSGFVSPATSTCTATETAVPAGYTSAGTCTATITAGVCTLTNTLNTAPFVVVKDFVPDSAAEVQVSLSCTSGSTITNDATASESDPAGFTVTGFVSPGTRTCTATEVAGSVPAGYTSVGTCTATIAAGSCAITNTEIEVAGASTIRTESFRVERAFVAGETVRLTGTAPDGCRPVLRVDGRVISRIDVGPDGDFDVGIATDELPAGRHLAEVLCSNGVLLSKEFWIAAPLTSSDILSVGLLSMLTLGALGFVGIKTVRENTGG